MVVTHFQLGFLAGELIHVQTRPLFAELPAPSPAHFLPINLEHHKTFLGMKGPAQFHRDEISLKGKLRRCNFSELILPLVFCGHCCLLKTTASSSRSERIAFDVPTLGKRGFPEVGNHHVRTHRRHNRLSQCGHRQCRFFRLRLDVRRCAGKGIPMRSRRVGHFHRLPRHQFHVEVERLGERNSVEVARAGKHIVALRHLLIDAYLIRKRRLNDTAWCIRIVVIVLRARAHVRRE